MDINKAFREHVTSTAFSLSLSKPQVKMLVFVSLTGDRSGAPIPNFVTTTDALARRGLLETRGSHIYGFLSDAGEAVIELLKVAGIFQETAKSLGFK